MGKTLSFNIKSEENKTKKKEKKSSLSFSQFQNILQKSKEKNVSPNPVK